MIATSARLKALLTFISMVPFLARSRPFSSTGPRIPFIVSRVPSTSVKQTARSHSTILWKDLIAHGLTVVGTPCRRVGGNLKEGRTHEPGRAGPSYRLH